MKHSIEKLRCEYGNTPLLEKELNTDPLKQFSIWLEEAIKAEVIEPNGMILSTVNLSMRPSSRAVLLKGIDRRGFVFFSHYESRKGKQLERCPQAALNFWWKEIYRQVTVEGCVKKISRKESLAYFYKRPRGAQLAALASEQSAPLAHRAELEEAFSYLKKKYLGKKIPCPKAWGGYLLVADRIEFWQGRKNRLHDRFLYVRTNGRWVSSRLAP